MKRQVICFTPGEVFDWIEQADIPQLQEIMDAIQDRYALVYPDWDILYLALPKQDCTQRRDLLKKAYEKLKQADKSAHPG